MRRSLFNFSQSRRVLLDLPLLAEPCQYTPFISLQRVISQAWLTKSIGGRYGIRTHDPLLAGQVLIASWANPPNIRLVYWIIGIFLRVILPSLLRRCLAHHFGYYSPMLHFCREPVYVWQSRRGSNPRPLVWQTSALAKDWATRLYRMRLWGLLQ